MRTHRNRKRFTVNASEQHQPGAPTGETTVFYSTPFGDTKDGLQKLFLLGRDGIPFYPVFYSRESTMQFFERMNRAGYMIIEGNIQAVKDTMSTIEPLKDAGIVIEPFSEHPVEIPPDA
jgi:hypothetical protein